ncbi:LysM peptidoglycan-binding domain-containing protein, partial [Reinekea forsetii]|nr:LysM peptidoglycan-binding domain-containing protein [Reinekea forsetii]
MSSNISLKNLQSGDYLLDLVLPAVADGNGSGLPSICIPLIKCESIAHAELEGSSKTSLQYADVALQMEGLSGKNEVTQRIRDGWIYIFVNGYLWHEYQVVEGKGFKDVDLRYWQTKDNRKANGIFNSKVVFPTNLNGETPKVQIAYSEVQWSWPRICSMGGMNPEDSRFQHVVKNGEVLSQIATQYSFLESTQALADANGINNTDDIQAGQVLTLRDADSPIGDADLVRESRMGPALIDQPLLGGDYSLVFVQDTLGNLDNFNTALTILLMNQQTMLAEMQGSFIPENSCTSKVLLPTPYPYLISKDIEYTHPKLPVKSPMWERKDICDLTNIAKLSYSTYLNEDARNAMVIKDIQKPGESDSDAQDRLDDIKESLEDTAKRLNKEDIENWLRVPQRTEIRKEYRDIQTELIKIVSEELDPFESFDFSIKLFTTLEDFAWLPSTQYHLLWSRLADIVNHLVIDPSTFDHQYDFKSIADDERKKHSVWLNKGLDIVEAIYSGAHPSSAWLFPSEDEVDIYSDQPLKVATIKEITDPVFRLADFQKAVANKPDEVETIDGEKNFFNFLNRFAKTVSALAENFETRPSEPIKKSISLLFRLIKGSGMPDIEGLHLITKGSNLEGKSALGKPRIERFTNTYIEKKVRSQRRELAAESASNQKQGGWNNQVTKLIDAKGKVVAASDISFLKPWKGFDPSREVADKRLIFEQHGKTGNGEVIIKAAFDVWVLPERSRLNGLYKSASQMSTNQLYSGATTQLPRIMLLMEAIALKEVVDTANNSHGKSSKELIGNIVNQTVNTLAAIVDVVDAWYDSRAKNQLIYKLETSKFKSVRFAAKKVPITIRGTSYIIPIIRWLGPIGALIGAGFTAWDSYKLFTRNDYDAAIITGVVTLIGVAGAAVGVIGGAMAGVSLMVPIIGWAIFAISLAILWAVNKWLRDTPTEYWAEHSPFSNSNGNRLDTEEFDSIAKSKAGLQNIIMQPSANVKKEKIELNGRSMHRVTVSIDHPGFILDESSLEWECTAKLTENMPSEKTGMLIQVSRNAPKLMKPTSISNNLNSSIVKNTILVFVIPEAVEEKIEGWYSMGKMIFKENEWSLK